MDVAQLVDLNAQHDAFCRTRYDGHNRRPIRTTMRQLKHRRARRRWRSICRAMLGRETAHRHPGWSPALTIQRGGTR